jgi:cell surface protein SprA
MSWAREVNGMFIPEQDANSISIIEEFKPLISADVTWINNFNTKIEINRSRSITLSFSNSQIIDLSDNAFIIGLGYRFEKLPIVIKTQQGAKQKKFESDLNLRGDLSIIDMLTIIRKIEEVGNDQITAGQKAFSLKLSADYALNERFNLKLFYDHAVNSPRISTSFRTSNVKFGVSVRFTLIP